AASRVPAAARLLVVDSNRKDIRSADFSARGKIAFEGGKAVGPGAHLRAVEVDRAVHVDAIELDKNSLARARCGQREGLPVPARAAIKVATTPAGFGALVKGQRNAPVMGHVQ